MARQIDEIALGEAIEREAGGDLRVLTDLHLGLSLRATARNDLHEALREVHLGLDLAEGQHQRGARDRLALLRVKAHLLAQAASYREALQASELAVTLSRPLDDAWELGRPTYSKGFVLWCQGRPQEAVMAFDEALALTQAAGSSLPRWIRCSRARALATMGRSSEAEEDLAASSHHLPEDVAYLAISRNEPEVAATVLEPLVAGGDPFLQAIYGIAQSLLGRSASGEEHLAAAEVALAAGGLAHYALAVQIHLGFCKEQRRQGSGRAMARRAAADLVTRGARTFAWPHPAATSWVCRIVAADPELASFARPRGYGGKPEVPLATRLREMGLTSRETEVALRVAQSSGSVAPVTRKSLAAELGISANTLRVHINDSSRTRLTVLFRPSRPRRPA